MDEVVLADRLADLLGDRRNEFTAQVRAAVRAHIEAQGKDCLTIVGRRADGTVARTWRLEASSSCAKCLIAFCRAQPYTGLALDSALTDQVIDVVTDQFRTFYGTHSDEIGQAVLEALVRDRSMLDALTGSLIDSLGGAATLAGPVVRQEVAALIGAQLQAAISGPAAHAIAAGRLVTRSPL